MAISLTLGAVRFRGFEIPENIDFGGEQALVIHKLPGGARTIDAMGRDDREIPWSGRFRGFDAESRAKRLDTYRIAGEPITLTWGGFRFRVVVRSFEAKFQQPFEIPYTIGCTVLADESTPAELFAPGLDEIIGADLGNLLGLSGPLSLDSVTDAVTSVQSAVATVGSLRTASRGGVLAIAGALAGAQTNVQAAIGQVNDTLGIAVPGNPAGIAASLSGQAEAFGQLNQLYQASSVLGRMGKNLGG